MQANLESLGTLERRLSISVPFNDIESEVQTRLRRVAKGAKIQGFRPGKAPLKIVEQHYGHKVREEVINATVEKNFSDAVRANSLKVAGYPRFEPAQGEPSPEFFKFNATFEVFPEIKIGSLADKAIEAPEFVVTDAEVEQTLLVLRKQRTRFNAVTRPVANGDRVILDFVGKIDDVPFEGGTATNFSVLLGEGQMLPDFEKNTIGLAEGESRTFDLAFPADYHGKDVAGKTAQFTITVKAVSEPVLPELDSDFANSLGIEGGDVVKMRAEIAKNVEREVARRLKARLKENTMQALLDVAELELPKSLISFEINRLVQQARAEFAQRGMDSENLPFPAEVFAEQAKRRVGLGLILAEIVKINDLKVTPEAVRAIVEDIASSYEDPEDVLKWYYSNPQNLESANSVALEDAVVAWALTQAKVAKTKVSFDELMGRN